MRKASLFSESILREGRFSRNQRSGPHQLSLFGADRYSAQPKAGQKHQSPELTKLVSHSHRAQLCSFGCLDGLPPLSRCPGLLLGRTQSGTFVQGSLHLQKLFHEKTVRTMAAIFPLIHCAAGNAHFMSQLLLGKTHLLAKFFDQSGDVIVSQNRPSKIYRIA